MNWHISCNHYLQTGNFSKGVMAEMSKLNPTNDVAWVPSQQYIEQSNIFRFMQRFGLKTLEELNQRAIDNPEWFWAEVEKDLDFEWFNPYSQVLDLSEGKQWAKWFKDGKINIAYNCLDRNVKRGIGSRVAVTWEGEDGSSSSLTYNQLLDQVNQLANGMGQLGIVKGDRVGIFMPMIMETLIVALACMRVGAIFIPIFSGYGPEAIAARLADCEAKILFTADGFWRRGRKVVIKEVAEKAAKLAGCIQKVVVAKRFEDEINLKEGDILFSELLSGSSVHEPEQTLADDPFMIIYTSGTTGQPKGTVHVHTGFPLKAAQDLSHCFDMQDGDVLFWVTDMGWMMGPWALLGSLLLKGTLVIYEGAQDYPDPGRLWEIVNKHGVNILGLSPTSIRGLIPHGEQWVEKYPMISLRVLGSTGEPWNPDPWWWYFEKVGHGRCPIINYSGGTEISGGILGCFPITPIKPCSFAGAIPGIDASVVNEDGQSAQGAVGELIIKSPWPGMTNGFWNAPRKYEETYWSRWPGVWAHGDLTQIDGDGFWYILGRSDDTIKVAGKRVGPAEVESTLVAHPSVVEAVAIGVPHEVKGETLVCFVVINPQCEQDQSLESELIQLVILRLGKSLQPDLIKFVAELPKTRNGKILRRVIRAKFLGQPLGDISALENPKSIEAIETVLTKKGLIVK